MAPLTTMCLLSAALKTWSRLKSVSATYMVCRGKHAINHKSTGSLSCVVNVGSPNPLVDDTVHIRVSGLHEQSPVTMLARLEEDDKRLYACGHYQADHNGDLDLRKASSVGGLFTGVEPMGLFWSMAQEPGQKPGVRIIKKNATTPLTTSLAVYDGHHCDVDDLLKRSPLASTNINRWYLGENVERREVREGGLKATFFIPKDGGPYPGVLDLFGGIGGTVEHRAALLASRGFATLALEYITPGHDGGIKTDLKYFEDAVEWLLRQDRVKRTSVGILSVSKGADVAIFTSSVCKKVNAVVAINCWHFSTLFGLHYKGEKFPNVKVTIDDCIHKDGAVTLKESGNTLPDEMQKRCAIPIERTNAHILLVHSGGDECADPASQAKMLDRMHKHGRSDMCEGVIYPGAGHLLEPPHSPHYLATYSNLPGSSEGTPMLWGGEPLAHARAQEAFWPRVQEFFRQHIN